MRLNTLARGLLPVSLLMAAITDASGPGKMATDPGPHVMHVAGASALIYIWATNLIASNPVSLHLLRAWTGKFTK